MIFSERYGFKPVKEQLPIDVVDRALKNGIWSAFYSHFLGEYIEYHVVDDEPYKFLYDLWVNYRKKPVDDMVKVETGFAVIREVKLYFFGTRLWYEYYDMIELAIPYTNEKFISAINRILEIEKSAFRIVGDKIVQITSQAEVDSIEESINVTADKFAPINTHLKTALQLLSDKQNPDYRNSIKEAISAVESACKILTQNDKATLGDALKVLERDGHLHSALKTAFSALYGYTSDVSGIRHALTDNDRIVDFSEAKFMLVICSSFVNLLISKNA